MNRFLLTRQMAFAVAALSVVGVGFPAFAARPVPFQGRADLVITGAQPLTASATGKATHLGRFTRTETIIVNPANGTFTGTLVFTAANGDQLYADVAGHFTSATGDRAEGTYFFTGGTGRFRIASGQAAFVIQPDEVGFDVAFKGTIQY